MAATPELKFGFEYETLVEPNEAYNAAYEKYKDQLPAVVEECGLKEPAVWRDEKNDFQRHRFLLATFLNSVDKRYLFKPTSTGDKLCDLVQVPVPAQAPLPPSPSYPSGYWAITHDGSVDVDDKVIPLYKSIISDRVPPKIIRHIEIVSPILTLDHLRAGVITTFIKEIAPGPGHMFQYWNNSTTSNHVHVSYGNAFENPNNLFKICMAWWWCEPIFMMMCGYWRRDNKYTRGMRVRLKNRFLFGYYSDATYPVTFGNKGTDEEKLAAIVTIFQGIPIKGGDGRRAALNMFNLFNENAGARTLEVRLKHGTTDPKEITMFMRLLGKFFVNAITKDCISNGANKATIDAVWKLQDTLIKPLNNGRVPLEGAVANFETQQASFFKEFIINNNEGDTDAIEIAAYWQKRIKVIYAMDVARITGLASDIETFREVMMDLKSPAAAAAVEGEPLSKKIRMVGGGKNGNWMFAYGSNGLDQLRERVRVEGKAKAVAAEAPFEHFPAYIQDYSRIFAGYSSRWDGGVASIAYDRCSRVYGTLVKLSDAEVGRLDKFEGGYSRVLMNANRQVKRGDPEMIYSCFVYIKNYNVYTEPPSPAYLAAITRMLTETGGQAGIKKLMVNGLTKSQRKTAKGFWDCERSVLVLKRAAKEEESSSSSS